MASLGDRLKHAWNVFTSREQLQTYTGSVTSMRPDRVSTRSGGERTILAAIYNRIAIDVAAIELLHVRTDKNKRYLEEIDSGLNQCLTVEANIDQAARAFKQDIVLSLFETGHIAIVPVETTINPETSGGYDIKTMRVGKVVGWFPDKVRVRLYDDRNGETKEVVVSKRIVAIVENPLYTVMNEPNSTLQRIIRKLNYLDAIDKQSSSGKLDMVIQLPYVIKSETRAEQAERRRKDLEVQLQGSQYGIAYIDGSEKITQLNRPAENNLLNQIEYLMEMLYAELGITKEVMAGTADEATMLNYYNRTIEPLLAAVAESMRRSFLTKTARTQGQTIMYFRDQFKLVGVGTIAEMADKMTRNEILTANEVRAIMGFKPATDPGADELRNKNIPEPTPSTDQPAPNVEAAPTQETEGDIQNGSEQQR